MKRWTLLLVLALAPGCMWVETMTKAATDAALEAVQAKIPIISEDLKNIAKKYKDEAIEAAVEMGAKKAIEYGRAGQMFFVRQAKLDPMTFDNDGDGVLSDMELSMAVNAARDAGTLPWYLQVLLYLGGGGALFTTVKTGRRKLGEWKNGGGPPKDT